VPSGLGIDMIDLHCHILPGIDDGATDLDMSLAMARMAVADGITHLACTPHITPGIYDNTVEVIARSMQGLRAALEEAHIPLVLVIGADIHLDRRMPQRLESGLLPTVNRSRYFLFEPPHHVAPPRIEMLVSELIAANYIPILTHPERLTWIESRYALIEDMVRRGALVQLTAGAITGGFGRRPKYWSEKMLETGMVAVISSDAHNTTSRPPVLSRAWEAVATRLGEDEAWQLVHYRPAAILNNEPVTLPAVKVVPQSNITAGRWKNRISRWIGRA
jgi:protein-tyrosine phosphatase